MNTLNTALRAVPARTRWVQQVAGIHACAPRLLPRGVVHTSSRRNEEDPSHIREVRTHGRTGRKKNDCFTNNPKVKGPANMRPMESENTVVDGVEEATGAEKLVADGDLIPDWTPADLLPIPTSLFWPHKVVEKADAHPDTSDSFENRGPYREGTRINWYPRHQRVAMDKIEKRLQDVDFIVEVRDARLPLSSINPQFDFMVRNKPRLIVYNKADLASPYETEHLRQYLTERYHSPAIWTHAISGRHIRGIIKFALEAHRSRPGHYPFMNIMVVGLPNVGKSTIVNMLKDRTAKGGPSKVGAYAGVTKKVQCRVKVHKNPPVYLVDTPGIFDPYIADVITGLKIVLTGGTNTNLIDPISVCEYLLYRLNSCIFTRELYPKVLELPNHKPVETVEQLLDGVAMAREFKLDPNRRDVKMAKDTERTFEGAYGDMLSLTLDADFSSEYVQPKSMNDHHLSAMHVLRMFQRGALGRMTLDECTPEAIDNFFNGQADDEFYIDTLQYKLNRLTTRGVKVKDNYV